jgi:uncharacterized alkaline shock family protein YloU
MSLRAQAAKQSPRQRGDCFGRNSPPRNDINKEDIIMGEDTTSLGGIHISPNAVATIAYHAVRESYGVVGLAPKNLADGLVRRITREPSRGVTVQYNGEDIDIEVHIIVEYGTRINSVAKSVANTVRFHVEKALGLRVNKIDVHVAGLRVSSMD